MRLVEIVLIAVGLAMDAFAVCSASGASGQARKPRAAYRLSFSFGLFQFIMPVAGWAAGVGVAPLVSSSDHWIAFLLLLFVGARMVRAGLSSNPPPELVDPSRGLKLVMLSVATSIDALAIGLSLAMLGVSIWYPSFVIGVVTFALSLIGFQLGEKLGATFGRRMETASGVLLVLIGIHILVSHLLA